MIHSIYDVLGAIGAVLILLAFFMASRHKWTGKTLAFQVVNLAGSLLLIIYSVHLKAYVATILNVVWAIVALAGVAMVMKKRR